MKYEVIWSDFAERQLDEIFEYYAEKANLGVAKILLQRLIAEPNKIDSNPEMLQREDLLIDRKETYRYIVYKNFKIIYSVDFKLKQIKIADVF